MSRKKKKKLPEPTAPRGAYDILGDSLEGNNGYSQWIDRLEQQAIQRNEQELSEPGLYHQPVILGTEHGVTFDEMPQALSNQVLTYTGSAPQWINYPTYNAVQPNYRVINVDQLQGTVTVNTEERMPTGSLSLSTLSQVFREHYGSYIDDMVNDPNRMYWNNTLMEWVKPKKKEVKMKSHWPEWF